jgi:hypothetical protein
VRAIAASFFLLEGFEVIAQPIEPVFPFGPAGIDPLLDQAPRPRLDPAGPDAADLLGHDQPGAFEHREVLHHRRKRHGERAGEVAHRSRAARKPFHHRPPRRIGKGLEGKVEGRELVKHVLK